MKVKVLFFANLREQLGTGVEEIELPDSASTVAGPAPASHAARRRLAEACSPT